MAISGRGNTYCLHTKSLGFKNCQPARTTEALRAKGAEQVAEAEALLQPSFPLKVEPIDAKSQSRKTPSINRRRRPEGQTLVQTTLDLF